MFPLSMFAVRRGNFVFQKSTQFITSVSLKNNQRFITTTKMVQIKVSSNLFSYIFIFDYHTFCVESFTLTQ